ncbi:MAG TPA: aryl-sulfate sulfotransferase [Phycisphaerae bacterium]|nr:aryl-sulfate sulfotransferase [Phycisphaerae bacterium]
MQQRKHVLKPDISLRSIVRLTVVLVGCLCTAYAGVQGRAQPTAGADREPPRPPQARNQETAADKRGLILGTDAASAGYTLFAPLGSTTTYLVDLHGELLHSWPSRYAPGQAAYLLDDGSLLRCAQERRNRYFAGGGIGGRVERIAPDGKLLWTFVCADENRCQHHDIKPLPNGHLLLIAWEKKTRKQAIAAGRDPEAVTGDEMWPDCVLEVEPQGESGGKIVWEWHVWDHLVQEVDDSKPNFGVIAEHPELIDLNYRRTAPRETPEEMKRLRALGYVGGGEAEETGGESEGPPPFGPGPGGFPGQGDWCHTNSIDYNARLDQIALSVHSFNEIWIIDHSTTSKETAGHHGGRSGKGGDLLYRWGNPRAYEAGQAKDQMLFGQHDVRWIPEGFPGSGHLTVFNNGPGRPGGVYSSVVEIVPPVDSSGHYRREQGKAFEPSKPSWEYAAAKKEDFFAGHISGAQRLPNGNTLICSGEQGRIFEVTAGGKTVWEYVNPYIEHDLPPDGGFGPPPGMRHGARFPGRGSKHGSGERLAGRSDAGDQPRGTASPTSQPQLDRGGAQEGQVIRADAREDDGKPGRAGKARRPGGPPIGRPWGPLIGRLVGPSGGGPWGPPGGDPGGGLFRAVRIPPEHPGVQRLLQAKLAESNREP